MRSPALKPLLAAIFLAGCATPAAQQVRTEQPSSTHHLIAFAGNDYVTRDEVNAKFNTLASEACGGGFSGAPQVNFEQVWFGKFYLTHYSAQGDVSCR